MKTIKLYIILFGMVIVSFAICAIDASALPPKEPEEKFGTYVFRTNDNELIGVLICGTDWYQTTFEIPSPVNESQLDQNGKLINPTALIEKGIISPTYKFHLSHDIYGFGDSPSSSYLGTGGGSFSINIENLRFKTDTNNAVNSIAFTGFNLETNPQRDPYDDYSNHCIVVNWFAIEFDATPPYILAHGIASGSDSWEENNSPGVLQTLDDYGVLYTRFSTTDPSGSVEGNATELAEKIKDFLRPLNAKKFNIIAHSKGGLDSQMVARLLPSDFEVLSLTTLSTPHLGTAVADMGIIQLNYVNKFINKSDDPPGYLIKYLDRKLQRDMTALGVVLPHLPGLADLTTQAASDALVKHYRGESSRIKNVFTFSADAGPLCNDEPSDDDIKEMVPSLLPPLSKRYTISGLKLSYKINCDLQSAKKLQATLIFEEMPNPREDELGIVPVWVLTYESINNDTKHPNDVSVGIRSANPGWGIPLDALVDTNHSEIKNGTIIEKSLNHTLPLR